MSVALLLPDRVADEVDGLRRAFGADVDYIAPHITVIPPVNIDEAGLSDSLRVMRGAASSIVGPLRLRLGPLDTFLPRNPVIYLAVGGDTDVLGRLRSALGHGSFDRPDPHAYVPHVTLSRGHSPTDDASLRRLLSRYERTVEIDRLHLLVQVVPEGGRRHWVPSADVVFEPRRVIGTGGAELELTLSELADPDARRFLAENDWLAPVPLPLPPWRSVWVVGRSEGRVVGVAWGAQAGRGATLEGVFVAAEARRQGVGNHLVAALEHDVARHGGAVVEAAVSADHPVAASLLARGWTERPGPGGSRLWRALGPDDLGSAGPMGAR